MIQHILIGMVEHQPFQCGMDELEPMYAYVYMYVYLFKCMDLDIDDDDDDTGGLGPMLVLSCIVSCRLVS